MCKSDLQALNPSLSSLPSFSPSLHSPSSSFQSCLHSLPFLLFLSLSRSPFLTAHTLPVLAIYPGHLSRTSCHGSLFLPILSCLSSSGRPLLTILFWLSCPDCPFLAVLSFYSSPGCLIQQSCPGSSLLKPHLGDPVLAILPWQPCGAGIS